MAGRSIRLRVLPGDRRNPFDGRGDLGHELFGTRRGCAGELGQMNHRYQFSDPRQGAHQVIIGPAPHLAKSVEIRRAATARSSQRSSASGPETAAPRAGEQAIHLANPVCLNAPGGAQLVKAVVLMGQNVLNPAVETGQRQIQLGLDLGDGLRHRVAFARIGQGFRIGSGRGPDSRIGKYNGQKTRAVATRNAADPPVWRESARKTAVATPRPIRR